MNKLVLGIPGTDSVNSTPIILGVVGCLAGILVVMLITYLILSCIRKSKKDKVKINKTLLSDDELDKTIIENADIKESDDE